VLKNHCRVANNLMGLISRVRMVNTAPSAILDDQMYCIV
jgi:hypothetical protein